MLFLRLKQAQHALADDRLDQAYELCRYDDVKTHRQGQQLIGHLTEAYVKRARQHIENDRPDLAIIDCNKAQNLAGNLETIGSLRKQIIDEQQSKKRIDYIENQSLNIAKQHIQHGHLSIGEQLLEDIEPNQAQTALLEAKAKRMNLQQCIAKIQHALKQDEYLEAIELTVNQDLHRFSNEQVSAILQDVRRIAEQKIEEMFNLGQIDRAQRLIGHVKPLMHLSIELQGLGQAIIQCQKISSLIKKSQPRKALGYLTQLQGQYPKAKWLKEAIDQTRITAENTEKLLAGPMGLINQTDDFDSIMDLMPNSPEPQKSDVLSLENSQPEWLPDHFLLQVDGVGAYLVVGNPRFIAGPVSHSNRPDIGFIMPPNHPIASFQRLDEDYMLESESAIKINDQSLDRKLLIDGDRIELSNKCRFRFHKTNPASQTAMLSLTSAKLPIPDVRHIILMDKDIIIGPHASSHIQTDLIQENLVFFLKNGQLTVRTKQAIVVGNHEIQAEEGLKMNCPIRIGTLTVVLKQLT